MRLENKYWMDGYNNRWNVAEYTEKQAKKASKSLVDCVNCEDCEDCEGLDGLRHKKGLKAPFVRDALKGTAPVKVGGEYYLKELHNFGNWDFTKVLENQSLIFQSHDHHNNKYFQIGFEILGSVFPGNPYNPETLINLARSEDKNERIAALMFTKMLRIKVTAVKKKTEEEVLEQVNWGKRKVNV